MSLGVWPGQNLTIAMNLLTYALFWYQDISIWKRLYKALMVIVAVQLFPLLKRKKSHEHKEPLYQNK